MNNNKIEHDAYYAKDSYPRISGLDHDAIIFIGGVYSAEYLQFIDDGLSAPGTKTINDVCYEAMGRLEGKFPGCLQMLSAKIANDFE